MKVIGIVGGIASGKSAVAAELARLGAVVLDADAAVHAQLAKPAVRDQLAARWGKEILDSAGNVDRKAVAQQVFGADEALDRQFLERLLHPAIREDFEKQLAELETQENAVAVIDAPLLVEAGWATLCDAVVFVECDRELRLQRALARGWSAQEFAARETAQAMVATKQQAASVFLPNEGSLAELREAVRTVWNALGLPAA